MLNPTSTENTEKKSSSNVTPSSPPETPQDEVRNVQRSPESTIEPASSQTLNLDQKQDAIPTTTQESAPIVTTPTPNTIAPQELEQTSPQARINHDQKQELQSQQISPHKVAVTKVKLSDELNIFDWFRSTDIINQIAEKAKNSVDSVITVLDPGMKEYLYSGGNINIIVISDSERLVSPIRDAFQTVFGRATVVAARYNPPETATDYPVKLACGFEEALKVGKERIKRLRHDTSNVPQNQVVVVIQPTLVTIVNNETADSGLNQGLNTDENLSPKWFLTYCMIIEDPVLGSTMNSYSQFIPVDTNTVTAAKEAQFPDGFLDGQLGFAKSIGELMIAKLNLKPDDSEDSDSSWIQIWSGLDDIKLINDLSISLAHLYRRKWNTCTG